METVGKACPYDTNGDGDCGRRECPHCGVEAFLGRIPEEMDPPDPVELDAHRAPRDRHRVGQWLLMELDDAVIRGDSAARSVMSQPRMSSRIRTLADREWRNKTPATRREFIDGTFRRYVAEYGTGPLTMSVLWLCIRVVVVILWRLYKRRNTTAPRFDTVEA